MRTRKLAFVFIELNAAVSKVKNYIEKKKVKKLSSSFFQIVLIHSVLFVYFFRAGEASRVFQLAFRRIKF
jgi:hypothetical protein